MDVITGQDAIDALRRVASGEDSDIVWDSYPHTTLSTDARVCAYECGLLAEPGDIYCAGCRSAQ